MGLQTACQEATATMFNPVAFVLEIDSLIMDFHQAGLQGKGIMVLQDLNSEIAQKAYAGFLAAFRAGSTWDGEAFLATYPQLKDWHQEAWIDYRFEVEGGDNGGFLELVCKYREYDSRMDASLAKSMNHVG